MILLQKVLALIGSLAILFNLALSEDVVNSKSPLKVDLETADSADSETLAVDESNPEAYLLQLKPKAKVVSTPSRLDSKFLILIKLPEEDTAAAATSNTFRVATKLAASNLDDNIAKASKINAVPFESKRVVEQSKNGDFVEDDFSSDQNYPDNESDDIGFNGDSDQNGLNGNSGNTFFNDISNVEQGFNENSEADNTFNSEENSNQEFKRHSTNGVHHVSVGQSFSKETISDDNDDELLEVQKKQTDEEVFGSQPRNVGIKGRQIDEGFGEEDEEDSLPVSHSKHTAPASISSFQEDDQADLDENGGDDDQTLFITSQAPATVSHKSSSFGTKVPQSAHSLKTSSPAPAFGSKSSSSSSSAVQNGFRPMPAPKSKVSPVSHIRGSVNLGQSQFVFKSSGSEKTAPASQSALQEPEYSNLPVSSPAPSQVSDSKNCDDKQSQVLQQAVGNGLEKTVPVILIALPQLTKESGLTLGAPQPAYNLGPSVQAQQPSYIQTSSKESYPSPATKGLPPPPTTQARIPILPSSHALAPSYPASSSVKSSSASSFRYEFYLK